ncbi:phospholipase A [Uliginosibacterium sp. H3]|uniref:Phospholipase A1 n=1 Tax=Uliginosibacterium silvisoli TaxID=3114758 RepID=A0ABU6K501_9RHOO|nr:phospholipase A [Uliginosibacterium sp. H3]
MTLVFLAFGARAASPDITTLAQCFKLRGSETDEVRLKCYDKAFAEAEGGTLQVSALPDPPKPAHLRNLWRADDEQADRSTVFRQYKQNYILPWAISKSPNEQPSSPNAANTLSAPTSTDAAELKFQLSVKSRLPFTNNESKHSWWLAYTQQSHWQVYDTENSRPFRESNYEPEFIYSYDLSEKDAPGWPMAPQFLNFGLVHQSNGQPKPRSRSWNRVYAQLGMEQPVGNGSLALLIRPWIRIPESNDDDNPDITRYLGYGDLELKYWLNGKVYSLLARKRSIQLDIPVPFLTGRFTSGFSLQYFNGYGESLIDYNQRHQTFGIGYSLPYGL